AAFAVTMVAVFFGIRRAFDEQFVLGARLALALVIAAAIAWLVAYPLRKLRRTRAIEAIEQRAPDFDGRLETYDGLSRADTGQRSPFLGLLAEDALKLARRIPITMKVKSWEISVPAALAALAVAALLGTAAFG